MNEFVSFQKLFVESKNSWSVEIRNIDLASFDISVKNPNQVEDVSARSLLHIIAEIAALDAESAMILEDIRGML